MSKEILGKSTSIENATRDKMIEAIKTSKDELRSPEQKTTDLTPSPKENYASEIIEKMESKIPSYVKLYSDLYKKYLHIMNNFCNTCYSSQKDTLDKMGINNAALIMFDVYLRSAKQMALLQIDIHENMIKNYVGYRLSALEFYEQVIDDNINNFVEMFPKFSDFKK